MDYTLPGQFEYDGMPCSGLLTSAKMIDGVRQLTMTPEDTIVATYPKSGTNWMKYLVYLVKCNGQDEISTFLSAEVTFLEANHPDKSEVEALATKDGTPQHRISKTHLPFRLLKKQVTQDQAKVIVVMRNPKDTLVSYYHFYGMAQSLGFFSGTWDDFYQMFKTKNLMVGDFFDYNIEWWNVRDRDNVLVVFYEEMKADLAGVVRKVAKFMGYELGDDVVEKIVHLTSFNQMKDNPKVNAQETAKKGYLNFNKSKMLRKGEVGDWRNYFSEDQIKYVDSLCEERCTPIGLIFQDDVQKDVTTSMGDKQYAGNLSLRTNT